MNGDGDGADTVQKFSSDQSSVFANPVTASKLPKLLCKYGYNPEEPRVPAGNTGGGRWTRGDQYAALL
jgi:hypothetical protein